MFSLRLPKCLGTWEPLVEDLVRSRTPERLTKSQSVLGGSWDLVSKARSTLIGVVGNYRLSYLIYNPNY